ncbi:MAG TPA: alpha/beta hydrolase [Mycobacteriales bacterium]|nr:alpha/beta hydrolase [Mycobacteriales bacterium]
MTHGGSSAATLRIGTLVLKRCTVMPHAYCGHIRRAWDPSGQVKGDLSVGFAFVPASDHHDPVLGTVVPHEGGPGYSTTSSGVDYAAMYGSLLHRRNLLLVDQRGTGRSAAIDCPKLQNLHGAYDVAARACGRSLGSHADLYGSTLSADDESAVITALQLGKVALYGDSYGTFYTEVFAGRHPDQVRSIVLDSAYPTTGETQWYPTQTPAMRHSLDTACRRAPACRSAAGSPVGLLRKVLHQVRRSPYRGIAYDADGVRHQAVVTGAALVAVAFGATYGPEYYREFAAALRSALHGDHEPLLRLVAENVDASSYDGAASAYSEGLDAAVTCADYPQLYNMADPPAKRLKEYRAAVRLEQKTHPHVYAPFTIQEYLHSVWEEANWCLKWPSPSAEHPAAPPAPPSGHYPSVPTLILSGELDSITTPAEGALVAAKFPKSHQVIIANSFHVTAEDDTDGCGSSILRRFVAHPNRRLTAADLKCAHRVPPVRALGRYRESFTATAAAGARSGNQVDALGRRAAETAAETVADLQDRWFNNYSGVGVGLYGGTWSYGGGHVVRFRLHKVRLTRDLEVSGRVVWSTYGHRVTARLTLRRVTRSGRVVTGSPVDGTVSGHWNTRKRGAVAVLTGDLGGRRLHASMRAP